MPTQLTIPPITATFTDAPAGADLPTGIYDVDFQKKVNALLAFYRTNTDELNVFLPQLEAMITAINNNSIDVAAVQTIHDAMITYVNTYGNSQLVGGGWNSTDDFKGKTVTHNGWFWVSLTAGSNINNEPLATDVNWMQGGRSVDTYITSDISGIAGSVKVDNEVIMTQANYDALATKDVNTIYNLY